MLTIALSSCLGVALAAFLVFGIALIARKYLVKPSPAGRGLFVYSDGKVTRSIDPIAAMLGLKEHSAFILERHLRLAYDGDEEAIKLTAQAARDVFGVPTFTTPGKPGLTVTECYRLIVAFVQYCEALKKNTSPLSTVPPSTDATQPPSSEATTNDSAPFGYPATEPAPA